MRTVNAIALKLASCSVLASVVVAQTSANRQPAQWRLLQEWKVGGEADGPHSLDYIGAVHELPNGYIVHFDYKTGRFHMLGDGGKPVRSFGRLGAGPGEVRNPTGFAVQRDGAIVVNDLGNRRFTIFGSSGDFLRSVPFASGTRASQGQDSWRGVFLDDGRLFERVRFTGFRPEDNPWVARAWDPRLTSVRELAGSACPNESADTVARVALRRADGQLIQYLPLPYGAPSLTKAVDPTGFEWRYRGRPSNEIAKYRIGTCEVAATIRLEGEASTVTPAEKDAASNFLTAQARQAGATGPDLTRIPATKPYFESINVDADGNVWVERLWPNLRRNFEVFNKSGVLIARVNINLPLRVSGHAAFGKDRILGLVVDQDNLTYLISLRVVRSSSQ